jgi:predicted dehydrogenase
MSDMAEVRLMTLDPGHFHAALVQKEMYPGVAKQVHVYAPLCPDLIAHLDRIAGFNARRDNPTSWELEIHTGPDPLQRMLHERLGNVLVLAGRNRQKIDRILAAVKAGLNVLADKPWIISLEDLPKLQAALDAAEAKRVIAYDIMTERYEITSIIQRELVNDPDIFGDICVGSDDEPGAFMESVHYLLKTVAGVPLRRPACFFDTREQGEGLTDVGTHLVDLVFFILFPNQPIQFQQEIQVLSAKRWPTNLTKAAFQQITGVAEFPAFLSPFILREGEAPAEPREDHLAYYCNTLVSYTVRNIHTKLSVLWDLEALPGSGDTHLAVFRGSRSRVEVRQTKAENFKPEVYVAPNRVSYNRGVLAALQAKVSALQARFPGIQVQDRGDEWRVAIPDSYRVGHEAHFAQVTKQFLGYLKESNSLPAWEKPNMLAKYFVTTQGVHKSRQATI